MARKKAKEPSNTKHYLIIGGGLISAVMIPAVGLLGLIPATFSGYKLYAGHQKRQKKKRDERKYQLNSREY